MKYRFYICDVFTDQRFGGNPLAVIPDARGISDADMQRIAREFNFSESTFVLPPEQGHTRRVRIFTPTKEVPFAGHPNIGTAFSLAMRGHLDGLDAVTFEEAAGLVEVSIDRGAEGIRGCELRAPAAFSTGREAPVDLVAKSLSLAPDCIFSAAHPPLEASVGLPFLCVELRDRAALERARVDPAHLDALAATGVTPDIHVYVRSTDDYDIRARMFAPHDGVPEDPATGSANCALAGLLAQCRLEADGDFAWRIAQGVEMGRPSTLRARARKRGGAVVATWIGGSAVMVAEGSLELPSA